MSIALWAMPTHPWLCPVKHLSLPVWFVGHNSGYFFMSNDTMVGFSARTNDSKCVRESVEHQFF